MILTHPFRPIYDKQSRVLILGTFPSLKSRSNQFYYGHPQNLFWRLLATIFEEEVPMTIAQKEHFLHQHKIAIWDVIASCTITGSADSTISNVCVNDLVPLLSETNITSIFTTGKKATELYQKYCYPTTHISSIYLPSPSPANRAYGNFEVFQEAYQMIRQKVEG